MTSPFSPFGPSDPASPLSPLAPYRLHKNWLAYPKTFFEQLFLGEEKSNNTEIMPRAFNFLKHKIV